VIVYNAFDFHGLYFMRSFNDAMVVAEYHQKAVLHCTVYTIFLLKEKERILLKNRRKKNIFIALS
jgi:hypothetical protein